MFGRMQNGLEAAVISAAEKVFPDRAAGTYFQPESLSCLKGERLQLQVVCTAPKWFSKRIRLAVSGSFSHAARIRVLDWMPCLAPANPDDPAVITSKPGLFPGPLYERDEIAPAGGRTYAFHVTLAVPRRFPAGDHTLELSLNCPEETLAFSFPVHVVNAVLPPQKLACEMWFHPDCIMHHYQVNMRRKKFWQLLKNCFGNMAEHGLNMLLTPLWTFPLDTEIGGERMTFQLLDIELKNGRYSFRFSRLKRWIVLARECGITHFSFSHIYTQWGLAAAPKIMVRADGAEKRLFGWNTPSESGEYKDFLRQLFPPLLRFLKTMHLTPENTYFH